MSKLELIVNGRRYEGWKSVRVTRSIESLAGSFALDVSDRWGGQEVPWPIAEEDACRVAIDDVVVLDGHVDQRSLSISDNQRSLSYSGRDRAAVLVDCSAVLDKWTFRNASVVDIARKVAAPFLIRVDVQAGLELGKPPKKHVVNPGETAYEVMRGAAALAGVLLVSDGAGGVLVTRAGTARAATPLVLGENILSASFASDVTERFSRYVVMTQVGGTDEASGSATRSRAEARDEAVQREERVLLIRPDTGVSTDYARRRADWEARIRAARAETVTVVVQGWQQPRGRGLWPLNALIPVKAKSIGVDGELLISQVEHTLSEAGETTQLRLVRPDAFTPEPQAAVVKKSGGAWKELAGGAR